MPVPIRADHVVYIDNLPLDLSPAEAAKIARVITAFADGCADESGDESA